MKIKRKLIKIGDSFGITIPKSICEFLGLGKGDVIEFKNLKKHYGNGDKNKL